MSDAQLVDRAKAVWLYWKLMIFKIVNGYYLAAAAAFLGFTDGPDWHTPHMRYVRLFLFVTIAGSKFLDGLFDQTASRLNAGKPPIGAGATEFLQRPDDK